MPRPSTRRVSLWSFEVDPTIQPRAFINRDAVKRYAMVYRVNKRELPPIKLGMLPDGRTILIDGFHRVTAAKEAGLRALPAEFVSTTAEVAPWLAFAANIRNGVPIPRSRKRVAFRRFVEARQNRHPDGSVMSSREVVSALPVCSHTTVLRWFKADFPNVFAEMVGRDPEEDIPDEEPEGDPMHDDAMGNMLWAESQLVSTITRSLEHVTPDELADSLRGAIKKFEEALGRPLLTAEEVMLSALGHADEDEPDF